MICTARIVIHYHLYPELHAQELFAKFSREFVDGQDGKRRHMLPGTYTTDAFLSVNLAFLQATAAALRVDPNAAITVSDGTKTLSHGCREVESESLSFSAVLFGQPNDAPVSPLAALAASWPPNQGKGGALGSMPVPAVPLAEMFGRLK